MSNLQVQIYKFREQAAIPFRQTPGSVGYDLVACLDQSIFIQPKEVVLVPTGIGIDLPMGYEAQIRPRSGLSSKNKLLIINSPGTIDSDYRGEIFIPIMNLGNTDFEVSSGLRIAQMIIAKYEIVEWVEVDHLGESSRGEKGFGSSGTH